MPPTPKFQSLHASILSMLCTIQCTAPMLLFHAPIQLRQSNAPMMRQFNANHRDSTDLVPLLLLDRRQQRQAQLLRSVWAMGLGSSPALSLSLDHVAAALWLCVCLGFWLCGLPLGIALPWRRMLVLGTSLVTSDCSIVDVALGLPRGFVACAVGKLPVLSGAKPLQRKMGAEFDA